MFLQTEQGVCPQLPENGSEIGGTREEFAAFIRADRERWKKALADARIEPN
jgi:hypothetical protein